MTIPPSLRIAFLILVICLCADGLVRLPANIAIDSSSFGNSEAGLENSNLIEETDFDEEFLIETVDVISSGLNNSKSGERKLDSKTARLSPVFPPPKYT